MAGKERVVIFLAITLALFVNLAPAQQMNPTTHESILDTNTVNFAPLSTSKGCSILWDTSHGIHLGYSPSGLFSFLAMLLTIWGYNVDENNQGVLNVDLSQYGIIVVCVSSSWYSPYTASEVEAIITFVERGGGLLIMGDNSGCNNQNINPVSQAFGTTCGVSIIDPVETYITHFAPHPVFENVSEISVLSAGEIESSSPSKEIAWYEGLGVVAAAEVGLGKVVVQGDVNIMAEAVNYSDNRIYSENVFDWLCPFQGGLFIADTKELSARNGGTIHFKLLAGQENGFRHYILLGSASGTEPGLLLPGGLDTLPLNPDSFTHFVIAYMNTTLFESFTGELTWIGSANAQVVVESLCASPGCVSLTLHFAYALSDPWDCVSNAVGIEIVD